MNVLEQLILSLEVKGADEAAKAVKSVTKEVKKAASESVQTGDSFNVLKIGLLGALGASTRLLGTITQLGEKFVEFSGIKTAAQMMDIKDALSGVTGSAREARSMLSDLKDLSLHSAFDVKQLAEYAAELHNLGVQAKNITGDLHKIADLGAIGRVPGENAGEFADQIIKLRGQSSPKIKQLMLGLGKRLPLGEIVSAGIGDGKKRTNIQAAGYLKGLGSGEKAYELLLKGAEALHKGAAAAEALSSPLQFMAVSMRELQYIMEPTGELIITTFRPLATAAFQVADGFRKANEATGGSAGLIVLLGGVVTTTRFLIGSIMAARTEINSLTAAITRLGVTAGVTAAVTGKTPYAAGSGVPFAFPGMKNAAGLQGVKALGPSVPINGFRAMMGRAAMGAKGFGGKALGMGGSLLKGSLIPAIVIDVAGNAIGNAIKGDSKPGSAQSITGGVIGGAASFGAIGLQLGSLFGPEGALIGGIGGAVIGGIKGYFDNKGDADERTANATERSAAALEELKGKLTGGGERARAITSDLEIQYSLAHALGSSFG